MRNLRENFPDILEKKSGVNPGADAGEEGRHVHANTSQIIAG
jgi:hypothetical protein